MAQGISSNPPRRNDKKKQNQGGLPGLNAQDKQMIKQRQGQDKQLQQTAGGLLPQIQEKYSTPFDFQKYQNMAPVQGDYQGWIDQQMGNYNKAFDERMNPQFQQQMNEFDQQAANKGWTPGSEVYDKQKQLMLQSQNDARTQAYAQNQGQAIQGASSLFNVGSQAQQNAYGMGQAEYNAPLNNYNNLNAAQSPMMMQNLAYGQQRAMQASAPRGGGGGGSSPFMGFGSAMDMWAAQDARSRANAEYQAQLQQRYAPKSPSYGAQLGGTLLGGIAQGIGQGLF